MLLNKSGPIKIKSGRSGINRTDYGQIIDWNFARDRFLDRRITFTRASTGTFVGEEGLVQSADVNVPRFDFDPITRACRGLLIEEARTNLCIHSSSFENVAWNKAGELGVTANAALAPDGSMTARRLTPTVNNTFHRAISTGFAGGVAQVFSVHLKADGYNWAFIQINGTQTYFDLASVAVGAVGVGVTATINALAGGWVRCSVSRVSAATDALIFGVASANAVPFFAGNGTSGVLAWEAQAETGSFPTSTIPTTSAAATRAADVCSVTGTNFSSWYRQGEGTFAVDFVATVPQNSSVETAAYFDDGAAGIANRIWISKRDGAPFAMRALVSSGGVTSADLNFSASPLSANARTRLAFAFAPNNFNGSQDGMAVVTDADGAIPAPVIARLALGNRNGANQLNGPIARFRYFRRALPNQLQRLTAL